ncbi:unnamed protein product [Boreogadus saida]
MPYPALANNTSSTIPSITKPYPIISRFDPSNSLDQQGQAWTSRDLTAGPETRGTTGQSWSSLGQVDTSGSLYKVPQ